MHDVFCLENLKGKRSLGRPRRRSENNMQTGEIMLEIVDWIYMAQDTN